MTRTGTLFAFILLLVTCTGNAQPNILFQPVLNGRPLQLNQQNDSIRVTVCRFYISNLVLLNDSDAFRDTTFYLIDTEDSSRCQIRLEDSLPFNEIRFGLGVDSTTSAGGAREGALDPVHGMYWAWQSGYINLKLEGMLGNQKFQLHLGGFSWPTNSYRTVKLPAGHASNLQIHFELQPLLAYMNEHQLYTVMSPSVHALQLSTLAASLFSVSK